MASTSNSGSVSSRNSRIEKLFKFQKRAEPAVQKKNGGLDTIALHLDEMDALAVDFSREIGSLIEASFDLPPVIVASPVVDEPP